MPPLLTVLFPHAGLGGGEVATIEVAQALAARFELRVAVVDRARRAGARWMRRELEERFDQVRFFWRPWELRAGLAGTDVLLWYGTSPSVPRALSRRRPRPASVRVVHTERAQDGAAFHRRWHGVIDRTIAVSPEAARRIPGAVFVPNTWAPARLAGSRHDFFPADSRPVLCCIGRLTRDKRFSWLLEALPRLDANLLFQAVDSAELTALDLWRRAIELGLTDRVHLLPPDARVGDALRSCDALVIASRQEALPMVAIEAGALEVPVISTRVGALPELFADEIVFFDWDDNLDSLRRAIAAADPERGRRLGHRVRQLCDIETVTASYEREISRALAARPASGNRSSSASSPK